jgi:predicted AlkP superfamily pyrophosphatase or phosphodiesterase
MRTFIIAAAALAATLLGAAQQPSGRAAHRQLIIVVDGLRPDYVTPEVMPNLYALGQRGIVFTNHHSVFPTVTRVNASSISTGSYPERHGLLGNTVFFPAVDPRRFLDTSDRGTMMRVNAATGGHLLTAQTLGETLQSAGRKMLVVSAGSTGSAYLANHTVSGGAILHASYAMPDSLEADALAAVGPLPDNTSSDALNRRAVDLFLKVGIPRVDPAVAVIWLTDPDTTAHEKGIGSPETAECLRAVDVQIKRIEDGLSAVGLAEQWNIWVTSDHGFSTHTGGVALAELLKPFQRQMPDGTPRIVTGGDGAIYVRDHDRADVARIVAALQAADRVGAIFTAADAAGSRTGWVPGTLSFDVIRWRHERSAEIMFSPDWTDETNKDGFKGTVAAGGVAGHGSSSPWDVHNTLIASGPDLKRAATAGTPSANVDFAPTVLSLLGIRIPTSMEGRVLSEAFVGGPDAASLAVTTDDYTARNGDGTYSVRAQVSTVNTADGRHWYFDFAKAQRSH